MIQFAAIVVLTACSLGALQQGLIHDNVFAIWSSGFAAAGALHSIAPMIKAMRGSDRHERS